MLIGNYAVGYHGYPRATADMDIWISLKVENVKKVVEVIRESGFANSALSVQTFTQQKKIVRMGLPPVRIEVISEIDGVTFEECWKSRVVGEIGDISANIIDLKNLKKNKKESGRLKDLADLENLTK